MSLIMRLSEEYPCDYLPGRCARSAFVAPDAVMTTQLYSRLAEHGYRRSGRLVYRPQCQLCSACVPVRIPVDLFMPSRAQRRTLKKNADLRVAERPAVFRREHFALFERYIKTRHAHSGMESSSPDDYIRFMTSPWSNTKFYEFRLVESLIAVAVVDRIENGLSAVYTFFDPALETRSPGVYAVLWQVQLARRLALPWVYLGYWIQGCRKMTYKSRFKPLEGYLKGQWVLVEKAVSATAAATPEDGAPARKYGSKEVG